MLEHNELKRYNRHIILPEIGRAGQEQLKKSKVLVVGAGGLGCPVLQYLVSAGVGRIGIVDDDKVSESNLQRQILFFTDDIGKPKAQTAKKHLLQLNPLVAINAFEQRLNRENAIELIQNFDLVIDCTDNFATRFLINDACVILNKPFVYGAIYKFEGQVSVFNYNNGPTYRCLVPDIELLDFVPTCSDVGVLGVLPGIIGTMQAVEAIKIIVGTGELLSGKIFIFNALNFNSNIITFEKNKDFQPIMELGTYDLSCSIEENDPVKCLTKSELKDLLEKNTPLQIIDIRESKTLSGFDISTEKIGMSKIEKDISVISKDKMVVLCCELGETSAFLVKTLQKKYGLPNLYNLQGGIINWEM